MVTNAESILALWGVTLSNFLILTSVWSLLVIPVYVGPLHVPPTVQGLLMLNGDCKLAVDVR